MRQILMTACVLAVSIPATPSDVHVPTAFVGTIDHPRYAFNYAVSDPVTRDNKAQWETRDGDVVKGSYTLAEPDGTLRVVDYSATPLTGFNAVVKNIGPSVHDVPAPVTPVVHGAPNVAPYLPIIVPPVPTIAKIVPPITRIVPSTLAVPLLAKTAAPLAPITGPISYGFGGGPKVASNPSVPSLKRWSLPWDPYTRSFGGWRPLPGRLDAPKAYVDIYNTQYNDGNVHKWKVSSIPLGGTLVIKNKH